MIITISGKTTTGKSSSLSFLSKARQKNSVYLNFDTSRIPAVPIEGYRLYKHSMKYATSMGILDTILEKNKLKPEKEQIKYIIVDTLTGLLKQDVTDNIDSGNSDWQEYNLRFNQLVEKMNVYHKITWIVLAHADIINKNPDTTTPPILVHKIVGKGGPFKGEGGMEANFGIVLSTRKARITDLNTFANECPNLDITSLDIKKKFKYVFQLQQGLDDIDYQLCSPMGLWSSAEEIFMDNNIDLLLNVIEKV